MESLRFFVRKNGGVTVIDLEGEMEVYSLSALKSALEDLIESESSAIALNMEKVSQIDSSGIGMIIQTSKRLQALKGGMRLFRVTPAVMQVLRTTKVISLIQVLDSEEEAVSSLD